MTLQDSTANKSSTVPQSQMIYRLRQLRSDATRLHSSLVKDLAPFQKSDSSFRTWPDKLDRKISVATTCTALMALITSKKQEDLFDDNDAVAALFRSLVSAEWRSSELKDKNAFTTAMVVRAAGFVVRAGILQRHEVSALRHRRRETFEEIVKAQARLGEESFRVEDYPPKTAMGYWFIDGVIGADVKLREQSWTRIADWSAREFHRELIYVSAGNDSLMDPPSLAMAACLINRIRRYCTNKSDLVKINKRLPSRVELSFGIEQVFAKQSDSGIWHKYFPLFHFPGGQGAADYCFSFEFLEAILIEFGTDVLRKPELLDRFERAVRWCDKYRLVLQHEGEVYQGWNSGGEVKNLAAGKPESWATASVHMFLSQVVRKVSDLLDELVLKRFEIDRTGVTHSPERLNGLIDVRVKFPNERATTLRRVLKEEIINNLPEPKEDPLYKSEIPEPRSALLFGPPGTSKTNLGKAIAESLGWPLIVITPSEFLGKGIEQVHAQVDEVFHDLMDLSKVVIFFDEMDALAQTREGEDKELEGDAKESNKGKQQPELRKDQRTKGGGDLDVTRQLLTTSMLPKLANLWDRKRVIFLMATNHKQQLDAAITRPGRFDLLLCVAPPTWKKKSSADALEKRFSVEKPKGVEKKLRKLVPNGSAAGKALDRFTVTEVGIFLDHLKRIKSADNLLEALASFKASEFGELVIRWSEQSITLRDRRRITNEYKDDLDASRRQYYRSPK